MLKCKWCENELKEINYLYCNVQCFNKFNISGLRKIVYNFALAMEQEMQRKDIESYVIKDKTIKFLIDKLFEEQDEVEECLIPIYNDDDIFKTNTKKLVNEELLHEGIMLALIRNKLQVNLNG